MNAALQQLGFSPTDRVVIVHADDIGMCQATVSGLDELYAFGLVTSAAVMVPCPWFPYTADWFRAHPAIDIGVHLTLNCEWTSYRWGPISALDHAAGMLDQAGYFHRWPAATIQQADPAAVAREISAQLGRALAAGIDVSHIDAHMGTVQHPRFFEAYAQAALDQRLPGLFFTNPAQRLHEQGIDDPAVIAATVQLTDDLVASGIALFDLIAMLPLDAPDDQVAFAKATFDALPPGLTMLIMHPAQDTPELRAIAPDWPSRVANYAAMLSPELRDHVKRTGVQLIGYRALRDLVQGR